MRTVVSESLEQTGSLGREIAGKLEPGSVIAFTGGLGSGKTTLIGAIVRGLGIEEQVSSPTFTLMHEYAGDVTVLHLDCYRLRSPEEAALLGLEEYFERECIIMIEWADRIAPMVPDKAASIFMSRVPGRENSRKITIEGL